MKLTLRMLVALGGLALFAWFVYRAGVTEILGAFSRLGWYAPLVLLPFAIVYVFDTLGWHFAFGKHPAPSFPVLMRIRWAGEAVNNVVPSAYIGGEAVKVYLLTRRGVPGVIAGSSAVTGKIVQTLGQVVFITLGAFAGLTILSPDSPARYGLFVIAAAGSIIVLMLFRLQRRGMFTALLGLARKLKLRLAPLERNETNLVQLDDRIRNFSRTDPVHFRLSFAAYLIGWICDALEVFLVSHLIGLPLSWTEAMAVEAFTSVAKALGIFVPGALGIQESGIVLLFRIFGLPEALGIPYAVIRRGREVIYAVIGGIFLQFEHADIRTLEKRAAAQTSAGP
ncbi:MAG TPA: flippase-like domain-containing protein [Chthoniobacterales bacterium]|nr:flippase-like domain-containing protein [Chthoniobacterales bacterium]